MVPFFALGTISQTGLVRQQYGGSLSEVNGSHPLLGLGRAFALTHPLLCAGSHLETCGLLLHLLA